MERILLLVEQQGNRRLLRERLTPFYHVLDTDPSTALNQAFDLAILDGLALEKWRSALQEKKRREDPVFLPILLLAPRRKISVATADLWQVVDDLLPTPLEFVELHARLQILLRTRRQSLDLKQQHDELEAFVEARRALERMKDEFIAMASHELRSPLAAITLYANMLAEGEMGSLTDDQLHFMQIVNANAERLSRLVSDLLDVSRLASGRLQLSISSIELGPLVQQVCGEIDILEAAKRIELIIKLPSKPVYVKADPDRLIQVLTNLLSNAYKYSPEDSTITIEVNLQDFVVQVDVIDQGIGVSELDQQQLFTKFFRTEEVRRKGIRGTGLGLYMTRSLVEMQQGRVWVKSQPGTGSTFSVALPRADAQPRRVEPPQSPSGSM